MQRVEVAEQAATESGEQLFATGQQPRFEQRALDRDVVGRFVQTFRDGAHAVADFQADVPEAADQALQLGFRARAGGLRQQDQQVDVGGRIEFAAPVTANGSEGDRGRERKIGPQAAEDFIDIGAALAKQGFGVVVLQVARLQGSLAGLEFVAQGGDVDVHQAIQSGFGRAPAESVMTS